MIFLGALVLRLVLMPVTMHSDLLFTNVFPHFLSSHGIWDIYGYFGDHYLSKEGHAYYAPLVYYLTAFAQTVLRPVNPGFDAFMEHAHRLMHDRLADSMADHLLPYLAAQRFRFVFMMKLPYLAAEGGCLFFIARIFRDSGRDRERALFFWLFSPVLIFSVYIFGTYRIYPALVTWALVYFTSKDRKAWSAVCLGLLCLLDNFPWFLFAPLLLILGKDWRERFGLGILAIFVFGLVFAPLYFHSHGFAQYAYVAPVLTKAAFQGLTRGTPPAVTLAVKAVFVLLYTGLFFTLLARSRGSLKTMDAQRRTELIVWMSASVLLAFYATSQTLAHYFMWVLPFFVIIQAKGEPWKPAFTWTLIGLLFLFNLDSRALNWGLLIPIDPVYFLSKPSLHEVMDRWVPWGKVVATARILFSLLCLELVRRIFFLRIRPILEGRAV